MGGCVARRYRQGMLKALAVGCVVLMGCGVAGPERVPGAPAVGSACAASNENECMTVASIGICDKGRWVEYPCDGRCSNAQSPRCVLPQVLDAGAFCPEQLNRTGRCDGPNTATACLDGGWVTIDCFQCLVVIRSIVACNQ